MRPNCIWRDKVAKYTEDLIEHIYNAKKTHRVNVYAHTQIINNCKNFKATHSQIAKDVFSDIAIQPMTEMELLHFTDCILRKQFEQSVIKPYLEMCRESAVLYCTADVQKLNLNIQKYNQRNLTELAPITTQSSVKLKEYFETEDWNISFNPESMLLKLMKESTEIFIQGEV